MSKDSQNINPPKLASRFLRWFCKPDVIEEIEGDLVELFELRLLKNKRKAKILFLWDVFMSIRLINMKRSKLTINTGMYLNYYISGIRFLKKDLIFSLVNITGLSIALSVFIAMIIMIDHEFSYDRFHKKGNRIFEVIQLFQNGDGDDPEIYTSTKLAETLRKEVSIVENAVTVHSTASSWFKIGNDKYFEENGIVAGSQFFEIFDFKLLRGDKKRVLNAKRSIVITENLSSKFFGEQNALGKEIEIETYGRFTVTGILENIPSNSFVQFNFIISQDYDVFFTKVAHWFPEWFQSWQGNPAATFVLLKSEKEEKLFSQLVEPVLKKYLDEESYNPVYLINLYDLHFKLNGIDGRVNEFVKGDLKQIGIFTAVSIIILILACFNYINITVARSIKRTKEVGIRKTMGAYRVQITLQFLFESFLLVFASFMVALGVVYFLIPFINSVTSFNLTYNLTGLFSVAPYLVATLIAVSIISGFYPALFLSKFSVSKVLKKSAASSKGNNSLRNTLVTFQYLLVIVMLTLLMVILQQNSFLNKKNLGFDTDKLVIVEINGGGLRNNYQKFKHDLLQNPNIYDITGATRIFSGYRSGTSITTAGIDNSEQSWPMRFYGLESNGLALLGIKIKYGQNFKGLQSDSSSIFLNETAAKLYGGEKVVGEWITINEKPRFKGQVIGIVEDFHFTSLREPIGPIVIGYYLNPFESLDDIVIKINGSQVSETLSAIETIHNKYDENDVMTWEFMDDMIQKNYQKEGTVKNILIGASFFSLLIALLGIIGLISYNIISREKEFGMRKILGASFFNILNLHLKSFIKLQFISYIIAIPISWWLISQWLNGYAYRIDLTPIPFLTVLMLILIVTFFTIYIISIKSFRDNPAESLRSD